MGLRQIASFRIFISILAKPSLPNTKIKLIRILFIILTFVITITRLNIALAGDISSGEIPTRYGLAGVFGKTFDPVGNMNYLQAAGFVMWDYDRVWRHWAPEPLRFKVEGAVGLTTAPKTRGMVSVGMMALYYLDLISRHRWHPYVEGGIGVIYTDFRVDGQGSRFNFNPQIGIGTEMQCRGGYRSGKQPGVTVAGSDVRENRHRADHALSRGSGPLPS